MSGCVENALKVIRRKVAKQHAFAWASCFPNYIFFDLDSFYSLTAFDKSQNNMEEKTSTVTGITRRYKILWAGEHGEQLAAFLKLQDVTGNK